MARQPLPLGSWGRVGVTPLAMGTAGRPQSYRARAKFRDLDEITREVMAQGKTRSAAEANLLVKPGRRSPWMSTWAGAPRAGRLPLHWPLTCRYAVGGVLLVSCGF